MNERYRLNMDFDKQVYRLGDQLGWVTSPSDGVSRVHLEREEAESGHTTSFVRFAPGAAFPPHTHPLGEEIYVMEGVFSDGNGDYPAGTYLRNPPGSQHKPFTEEGCTLFVKLDQFQAGDTQQVVIRPEDQQWQPGIGNPTKNGLFINPYTVNDPSAEHGFGDILKWRLSDKPYKAEKEREKNQPGLPVMHSSSLPDTKEDYILWLGHASVLIQIEGKRLLTDPCLTAPPMFTRHTELPIPLERIQPDYLLISHGHYDHLDSDTLAHCNHAKALIPLKMTSLVQEMNATIECQEAGWYQQYTLADGFEVVYLPANHWYRRTPFDKNEILWGSFLIKTPSKTLYFAGDTGYADHFKEINQLFGKIDIAFLPIGAYEPRWFMKASHMNPQEALQAYRELDAGVLIPMHYGTFDLTDEPLSLPPKVLKEHTTTEKVKYLTIGETWFI